MKFDWKKPAPLPLLVAGCSIGFLVALIGAVRPGLTSGGVPDHAVAIVNGVEIRRADYNKHIEGLKDNKQGPLTDTDREHVLERMIEEEVLVQRASEIGLLNSNRSVRGTVVRAMISAAISEESATEVTDGELRGFYKDNVNFFKTTSRLRLQRIMIPDGKSAAENAGKAIKFVKEGGSFNDAAKRWGEEPIAPLPNAVLPLAKVREYIGNTLLEAALKLREGELSEALRYADALHIIRVVKLVRAKAPGFSKVRAQVEAEYRRQAGDRALVKYTSWLKRRGDIGRSGDLQ